MPQTYPSRFVKAGLRADLLSGQFQLHSSRFAGGIAIDDITLAPGGAILFDPPAPGYFRLLLPLAGSVAVGEGAAISRGELLLVPANSGPAAVANPFPDHTVNFLAISLPALIELLNPPAPAKERIDMPARNGMTPASGAAGFISAGVYDSRATDSVRLAATGSALVFVIDGAFVVEGRRMERRDGLLLRDQAELELEALCDHAAIIVITINNDRENTDPVY